MTQPSPPFDLTTYLHDRDVACPVCAEPLRNLTTQHCPSCREELQLSLSLADPKVKLWLTCAIPLLLCSGVGSFVLLNLLRNGFRFSGKDVFIAIGFLASIPFALACVLLRRQFNRLPRVTRITLAVLSILLPVSLFGSLFLLI